MARSRSVARPARRRLVAGLLALSVSAAACSGPDLVDGSGDLVVNRAVPSPTVAPTVASPSGAAASAGASAGTTQSSASPALQLLGGLRTVGRASWRPVADARTGTRFSLPGVVPARTQLQNGISQRIYAYRISEQSTVSVGYVRAPSAAAAHASLGQYPAQLQASVRALGADDSQVTERRTTTIDGRPALSFRFTFTPTTVPQIPPVWLVTATADGQNVVLAQTIVFPPSPEYDYLEPARTVQQRLVQSLRLSS